MLQTREWWVLFHETRLGYNKYFLLWAAVKKSESCWCRQTLKKGFFLLIWFLFYSFILSFILKVLHRTKSTVSLKNKYTGLPTILVVLQKKTVNFVRFRDAWGSVVQDRPSSQTKLRFTKKVKQMCLYKYRSKWKGFFGFLLENGTWNDPHEWERWGRGKCRTFSNSVWYIICTQ